MLSSQEELSVDEIAGHARGAALRDLVSDTCGGPAAVFPAPGFEPRWVTPDHVEQCGRRCDARRIELERSGKGTALITMCCGASIGTAAIIERI